MGYGLRDGDVISTTNPKIGALTLSQPLTDYRNDGMSPRMMWETQSAVKTVVGFVTDSIAAIPFNVYDRKDDGGRIKNSGHKVARALWSPGYKLGQRRWVQQLIFDAIVEGRWAFTVLDTADGGFEFLRLPADRISFAVDGVGRYTELVLHTEKGPVTRPLDDVVFDVGVSATVGGHKRGSTPLTALEGLARELEGMTTYRENLFRNSAMVPAVIERPVDAPKWNDDVWARFKREFSTYRAGGGNAGGTPLLEDGMKLKPVDVFNPRDAQYVEVRQLALVEAAQALRIPPELVGAKDGTHSNIVALREQLYVDVLGPQISFFEDALNIGLDKLLGSDRYVEANLDAKLRGSMEDRAKIYQTAGGRPWMTTNEIRERENLPHIPGGDELVTPLNVLIGGQASPADGGATGGHPGADNAAGGQQGPESDDEKAAAAIGQLRQIVEAGVAAQRQLDRVKAQESVTGAVEVPAGPLGITGAKAAQPSRRAAVEAARERFEREAIVKGRELRSRWFARLGIDPNAKSIDFGSALPVIDPEWLVDDVDEVAAWLSGKTGEIANLAAEELIDYAAQNIADWSPDAQRAWIETAARTQSDVLLDSRFHQVVADAISENPGEWMTAVVDRLGSDDEVRKWAVEVGTEVESFGSHDAAKATGLSEKTWNVTSSNPRESHSALSGMTIPIEDVFPNGLRWPGDWYGDGPETANCRCRLTYS